MSDGHSTRQQLHRAKDWRNISAKQGVLFLCLVESTDSNRTLTNNIIMKQIMSQTISVKTIEKRLERRYTLGPWSDFDGEYT